MTKQTDPHLADPSQYKGALTQVRQGLISGNSVHLTDLFQKNGSRVPTICWSPQQGDIQDPVTRSFNQICYEMSNGKDCIAIDELDVTKLSALFDWLLVVDVCPRGQTFTYAHYGTGIADYYGLNLTGRNTTHFADYIGVFFTALYGAVMTRKQRVQSEHEPAKAVLVKRWNRVIVPVIDKIGDVVRFIVINHPESKNPGVAGRISRPCFIADSDMRLLYANKAAQPYLAPWENHGQGLAMASVLRSDIKISETPEHLFTSGQTIERPVANNLPDRPCSADIAAPKPTRKATISGTRLDNEARYLITLS